MCQAMPYTGPWEVQARWLSDAGKYNELMNEEDYEVDDEQKQLKVAP